MFFAKSTHNLTFNIFLVQIASFEMKKLNEVNFSLKIHFEFQKKKNLVSTKFNINCILLLFER